MDYISDTAVHFAMGFISGHFYTSYQTRNLQKKKKKNGKNVVVTL